MVPIRAFAVAIIVAILSASAVGNAANSPLDRNAVRRLERTLSLPSGAYRLASYDRYYTVDVIDSKRVIVGMFIHRETGKGRVRIVSPDVLPVPHDGGCAIIQIVADFESRQIVRVKCNQEV